MPCDTKLKPNQTLSQRAVEVRDAVAKFISGLVNGRVKVTVSKQGAIAFDGLTAAERDNVTDACAYRRIMATGSATAKLKIQQAEQLAGRSVSREAIGHGGSGIHSHDGGKTFHHGH